jgi:hypothetical protein
MQGGRLSVTNDGWPFNPVLSTTVICEVGDPGPEADYFVGFLYNNTAGDSFIITASHCIHPDDDVIYPRFRSVSDTRALPRKRLELWDDGDPIWRVHPYADVAAIPLKIDVPDYNDGEIVYDETWPHDYERRDYSENADVHHRVYAAAFTEQNIPKGQYTASEWIPFAGDEVSVICFDKISVPGTRYNDYEPPSNPPLPKIRDLTISTPYRLDYDDLPAFLNDGRLFKGSSGAPVLYIPPTQVYSDDAEARMQIKHPILIGVHGKIIERTLDNKPLNLFKSTRAEELIPITEPGYDWDTTPDI